MLHLSRLVKNCALFLCLLIFTGELPGQFINVGNGSYTTRFPGTDVAGRNAFPSGTPYTTGAAATKPVPTNDWWSAQIKKPHADNLFNYPFTLKTINSGLVVSYIPWGVIDDQLPVIVGVSGLNAGATNVSDFSDWTVSMDWQNAGHQFQATSGIGMPFLYFSKGSTDEARVTINHGQVTLDQEMMVITNSRNGADFAIYAPTGSEWVQNGNTYTSTLNGKNYWSLAFLPASASSIPAVAEEYKKYAYVFPTNTTADWHFDESTSVLRTDFTVETEVKEGTNSNVLMGLLPHQWDHLAAGSPIPDEYTYPSVRGELKTLDGNSFSVENTFYGILPTLPYLDNYSDGFSALALDQKIKLLENEGLATWTDSYNQGQEMNKLIQTARIADLMGNTSARDKMLATVKARLEDWLVAEGGEVAFLFYYNQNWSALLGYPAGHGQDSNINDHHFHWGYFIHAAAFVEQFEPGWSSQWGEMINHLVRDAANENRSDETFPFLRNFSPYAGHCWANGFASFPQGNDQESTSESMQFNSSLIHWGAITGDDAIRDLGIYLYTTEQTAIEEYWLDMSDRNFAPTHPYSLVSRVWGNSYDNGTFWTNDLAASYGIELYPIHGGSLYLGQNTDYVQRLWTEITQNTGILNNAANPNLWHDIMWEYLAFIDPEQAITLYNSYPDRELKFGVSDAQTYHWLHAMNALGTVDISVTSDNPLAAAFNKDGEITYVAHNYESVDIEVTFSDGYTLSVPAMSMATSRDLAVSGVLSSSFPQAYPGGSVNLSVSITGGTPDSVVFYQGDAPIGTVNSAPFNLQVEDLSLGIHGFYAKIYLGEAFSVTNSVSVQVGSQTPYQIAPITIPGSFQAGHFDVFEGGRGQNISYNDVTPTNLGDFRLDEYVDAFSDESEGDAIGWIATNEWLEYTVNVQQPGNYTLHFRYASGNVAGGGPFRIESDGEVVASDITVSYTGDWGAWATKTVQNVPLKGGLQVLRLFFENGEFNLGSLTFEYDSPLDYNQPEADAGEDLLVVLPENMTSLDGSNSSDPEGLALTYTWTQSYGPSALVFSDANLATPTVSNLEEGVYLVKLTVDNGSYSDEDELFIISSTDSNFAPEVFLSGPANNTTFFAGSSITVTAVASDLGGVVTKVEFFANNESMGIDTEAPYAIDWTPSEGDYQITAVATDNDGGSSTSEVVNVSILAAPELAGTWRMSSEAFSLGVGPAIGDLGWWSCDAGCVAARQCYFDDEYIFEEGGVFRNDQGEETWIESWQDGIGEGCRAPVSPHNGVSAASWSLNGNLLTIEGPGSYLGLPKVYNGGELNSTNNVPGSITYPVVFSPTGDTMTIDINYGAGFWHYVLVKDQTTGIHSPLSENFKYYPNPVSDILNLELPLGESEITLYDLAGKRITRQKVFSSLYNYDMRKHPAGIYFFEVRHQGEKKIFKVAKE
jgi:endo-1,3(4)-beta-glucanase